MPSAISRRALLGAGFGLLVAGAVGCSDQVSGGLPTATSTGSSALTPVPASPVPASSAVGGSSSAAPSSAVLPPGLTTASSPPIVSAAAAAGVPAAPAGPATEIGTGPTNRPMVALTFHGGGDPATATAILDICAQRGARITVLAIGTWLQENPSLAAAILGGGHDLGNHTWSHPVLSELGRAEVRDEITRCRDLLVQLTGSPGAFFRTSSGQHASPLILDEAGAAGYATCLSYDIDPQDWTDPGAAAVLEGVRVATAGSIVSLHFGHIGTVQALPDVLDELRTRGLEAVTATTLLAA